MENNEISKEIFIKFFKPNIRVLFNWRKLNDTDWKVEIKAVNNLSAISHWYMPWNIDGEKKLVDYNLPDAKPIQLKNVSDLLCKFDKKRQNFIKSLAETYKKNKNSIQIIVPTYLLKGRNCLLLDGNHRMSALMLSKVRFNILNFMIKAPIHKDIVPELRHWQQP